MSTPKITLSEQGLRDGLQSKQERVSTQEKLKMISALISAGLRRIQVCSFVHPRLVPQMADAEQLCAQLPAHPEVTYSGLALNRRGVERALNAGLDCVVISHSASDAHSRKNTRQGLDEAAEEVIALVSFARAQGVKVRAGVQCAFGCRLEGEIAPLSVLEMLDRLIDAGADEVALADSTGMGHPALIRDLVGASLERAGARPLWLHLHDTEGKGMVNALAAVEVGARFFDVAFGGLGGCPFIKSASGNLATEDFSHLCEQLGWSTGIDPTQVAALSRDVGEQYGWRLSAKMSNLLGRDDLKVLPPPSLHARRR